MSAYEMQKIIETMLLMEWSGRCNERKQNDRKQRCTWNKEAILLVYSKVRQII